jgi:hypothetical protein
MNNAHSEMEQTAVCCQNLMLGSLSSRSMLSTLVDALFKKFSLFLNMCKMTTTGSDLCPVVEFGITNVEFSEFAAR